MQREISHKILLWSQSSNRKPLLLLGARQVGKTHALNIFAKEGVSNNLFKNSHYFNFEEEGQKLAEIFEPDLSPERIISELSLRSGTNITTDDFIIFDEIQASPNALNSLKYFAEKMPDLCLAAAGSLLGLQLSETSFPVGKVDRLWLGPLTFREFLAGIEDEAAVKAYDEAVSSKKSTPFVHSLLWEKFRLFSALGGLPEVVNTYNENSGSLVSALEKARQVQTSLLKDYYADIAKHSGKNNSMHIQAVFENIPSQLGQNLEEGAKKFKFGSVLPKKRGFAELQGPIKWLIRAGLVYQVKITKQAEFPLETFCKESIFKLYIFDVGLLGALSKIPIERIYQNDYGQSKGVFAENVVLQLLVKDEDHAIYCWNKNTAEIEFLTVVKNSLLPVEVKASHRTRSKSLKSYLSHHKNLNEGHEAVIFSSNSLARNERPEDKNNILRLPSYLAGNLEEFL